MCLLLSTSITSPLCFADTLIAFELALEESRFDGCTNCGCQLKGELSTRQEREWWVSYGVVRPDSEKRWQADRSSSYCGAGDFGDEERQFLQTVGVPFVVMQIGIRAKQKGSDVLSLEIQTQRKRFAALGQAGAVQYTEVKDNRTFDLNEDGGASFPLLVPNEPEAEAFGMHDAIINLRATVLQNEPPARFGSLRITADVPGSLVLLDGGEVGRIEDNTPLLIENVRVGKREVLVRDFSAREVVQSATVKPGQTTDLSLKVLQELGPAATPGLLRLGNNPQGHPEYWRDKDAALMIQIPAGAFLMGSPEGVGEPDERPQHSVHVDSFLVDKTEVTWRQFKRYARESGAKLPPPPIWGIIDNYPISFILWDEASAYCAWVGGRLPTEAEWEKAARGTDGRAYPWGDSWDATRCNSIAGGMHRPVDAGSSPDCISTYGALDIAGNMWEWTSSKPDAYTASAVSEEDDAGIDDQGLRVMRGGAWMSQPNWLRSAYRHERSTRSRNMDHGFRCVMDANGADQ